MAVPYVPENLPSAIAIGLYRIAQGVWRNVSKHAGRTHVKIILKGSDSSLRLPVVDSGRGFDISRALPAWGSSVYSLRDPGYLLCWALRKPSAEFTASAICNRACTARV